MSFARASVFMEDGCACGKIRHMNCPFFVIFNTDAFVMGNKRLAFKIVTGV